MYNVVNIIPAHVYCTSLCLGVLIWFVENKQQTIAKQMIFWSSQVRLRETDLNIAWVFGDPIYVSANVIFVCLFASDFAIHHPGFSHVKSESGTCRVFP